MEPTESRPLDATVTDGRRGEGALGMSDVMPLDRNGLVCYFLIAWRCMGPSAPEAPAAVPRETGPNRTTQWPWRKSP